MKYDEAKNQFIKTINSFYHLHNLDVFADFCRVAAISLYQPFAKNEELEQEYLRIINKYKKEEQEKLTQLLAFVVFALEDRFGDFLGECYMQLEIGNKNTGQFFTPYHISSFMAQILTGNSDEFEKLAEPTCGSGGMIIARADALQKVGINYQQKMFAEATDIDPVCVDMCFIHLTLLHIPAIVIHGNSLSNEIYKYYYTPAYFMNMRYLQEQLENKEQLEEEKVEEIEECIKGITSLELYSQEQLETFSTGSLF